MVVSLGFAQSNPNNTKSKGKDKKPKPSITLYEITSASGKKTHVDTTLSLAKDYKFNYLRKDDFGLMPFLNVGQTYNTLIYSFDKKNTLPLFAAQSHHFNYLEIEDMEYFRVPTPLTELYFKTAFKQGQQLDAFFTINTNDRFNFSIAYKGVRSLGSYQHMLTSTGNFRFTTNYTTRNKRYRIKAHVAAQDILNEENGGLTDSSIALFREDNSEFTDRGRLEVKFENAENKLEGLRFYGYQEYDLFKAADSLQKTQITIGNEVSYEDKFYEYRQNSPFSEFGPSYLTSDLKKKVKLEDFNIRGSVTLANTYLGVLKGYIGYRDYNYGYNSVLYLDDQTITNRIKGGLAEVGADYSKQYKGFALYGSGAITISGDLNSHFVTAGTGYEFTEDLQITAEASIHSVAPNFNFLLFQSDYVNYNWQNDFDNVKTQELEFKVASSKWATVSASYTGIEDYTYFTVQPNDSTPSPVQANERVDYLKIKLEKEFRYKKFGFENTIMFQEALQGDEHFKVPQIVTRNTLYFQDEWFKKALFMQTGVTFRYFSSYNMNAYDPVLAEFYVQNEEELGGFPMFDLFFNAKVRQTRIFFKYENFNSLFASENTYFSAPGYPYRDAVIRFGIVWNFFL